MVSCQVFLSGSPFFRTVNSLKDFSTNGFTLNGYDVRRSSVLLMDGDIMELPSSRSRKSPILWDIRINGQSFNRQDSSAYIYVHNAEKGLPFLNPPHRHNLHRKLGALRVLLCPN
jgi:hypothetical protein